jgi:hypothetical protein
MDLLDFNCKNLLKNLLNMTLWVLLLKNLDSEILFVLQLIFELMFSQYQIQMPLIHHHHAATRITTHLIKFLHIFEDKEKQLRVIQRIPQPICVRISILQAVTQKNWSHLFDSM